MARVGTSTPFALSGATTWRRYSSTSSFGPNCRRGGPAVSGSGTGSATVTAIGYVCRRSAHSTAIGTNPRDSHVSSTQATTPAPNASGCSRGPTRIGSRPSATTRVATEPTSAALRPRPWLAMQHTAPWNCSTLFTIDAATSEPTTTERSTRSNRTSTLSSKRAPSDSQLHTATTVNRCTVTSSSAAYRTATGTARAENSEPSSGTKITCT